MQRILATTIVLLTLTIPSVGAADDSRYAELSLGAGALVQRQNGAFRGPDDPTLTVAVRAGYFWDLSDLSEEDGGDLGPAAELGGGAVYRAGRYHLGIEAIVGVQGHQGQMIGHDSHDLRYFGITAGVQVLGGVGF